MTTLRIVGADAQSAPAAKPDPAQYVTRTQEAALLQAIYVELRALREALQEHAPEPGSKAASRRKPPHGGE